MTIGVSSLVWITGTALLGMIWWTGTRGVEEMEHRQSIDESLEEARARPSVTTAALLLRRLKDARVSNRSLEPELKALRSAVADATAWNGRAWDPAGEHAELAEAIEAFARKWSVPREAA